LISVIVLFDNVCFTRSSVAKDPDDNVTGSATVILCRDVAQNECDQAEAVLCNNAQHAANLASGAQKPQVPSFRPW
jgi:hypothetical protein